MGNPNSPLNGQGNQLDLVTQEDGTAGLKLGYDPTVVTGASDPGLKQGVALFAWDGITLRKLILDASGRLLVAPAPSIRKTYFVGTGALANTTAKEIFVVESYAAAIVRLARIVIWQVGTQTTPGVRALQLLRTTTAGTGGAVTPEPADAGDAPYSGLVRVTPTAGSEGTVLDTIPIYVPSTAAAHPPIVIDYDGLVVAKKPLIKAGTANGIALKDPGATGAAGLYVSVYFTDET